MTLCMLCVQKELPRRCGSESVVSMDAREGKRWLMGRFYSQGDENIIEFGRIYRYMAWYMY